MIYSNSTDYFRNQSVEKPYENCTVLKNQVKYLIKTCARLIRGEENLEVVLGSQNCVFGKAELGYNPSFQKVCQVICHSFHATTVWKKVMLLSTVMLENMMFLNGL